jgi:hypothetical protein
MAADRDGNAFPLLLAGSIGIGVLDISAFRLFPTGLLSDGGVHWMLGALLSWIALFLVGMSLLGVRSLWLLIGLPLVFALFALGAGQI